MAKAATKSAKTEGGAPVPRLKEKFENEILPAMREKFGRENRLALPRIEKIVVSMGVGSAMSDKKHIEEAASAMTDITGQKALICKARKSIANFRLREGVAIGRIGDQQSLLVIDGYAEPGGSGAVSYRRPNVRAQR
jgi:hypothetical protein